MKKTLLLIGLITLCLAVSNAAAAPFVATTKLEPTQTGYDLGAAGKARISKSDQGRQVERFVVTFQAKVEDGTILMISATTRDGKSFDVAAVRTFLGTSVLELNNLENDLNKVFPVEAIKSVSVSLEGRVILEGKFVTNEAREQPMDGLGSGIRDLEGL